MTKWFYATDQIYQENLEDSLNQWAERGWELVTVAILPPPKEAPNGPNLFLVIFRRPGASA